MRRIGFIVALLAVALALAGCAQGPNLAEQKQTCFANEALLSAEMKLFNADTGMDAPFPSVVEKMDAVCPAGGTYSYDPATGVVSCSVHGHP